MELFLRLSAITALAAAADAIGNAVLPSPGVSNVVFSLVRGTDDARVFIERTSCLSHSLDALYDQVVFHQGDIPVAVQTRIQASAPVIRFIDAREYGAFTTAVFNRSEAVNTGYRHMERNPA